MKQINRIMKRSFALILAATLLTMALPVTAQDSASTETVARAPRPAPYTTITEGDITVDLFFENVPQGRAALVGVYGENVAGARVRFRDKTSECYYVENDGFYGIFSVNLDQTPRVYDFSVLVWRNDGTRVTIPAEVRVVNGGFLRQDVNVPADLAYLTDPEIERIEFARMDSVVATYTPHRWWADSGFQLPIQAELTSAFGGFRTVNDTVQTRHTGWDLRAPVGTPVMTMGAGRVAFAGLMDIRGNHIIIDHGYGVYSTYSHLSQVHVTRGQTVTAGQIIGVSGNTGRSSGAHFHWEVIVNGNWIDSADFIEMWLP